MARPLVRALADRPLFFEPVPPTARASALRAAAISHELVERLKPIARLDAVNVPELVDENHDGRPYYRSGDARAFAHHLGDATGAAVIVNKVVAHLASEQLATWIDGTLALGVPNVVLVGGSSRYIPYPGPAVAEANRLCAPKLGAAGGFLGNIAIPQRLGEAHRMLLKARAGASFFTTQIVFDAGAVTRLAKEYDALCRGAGVPPQSLLISVAPIADEGDAEFVRWLGADLPESAERAILNGDERDAGPRSVRHALDLWAEVWSEAQRLGLRVPLGVNVEQISQRHLGSAVEMLAAFAGTLATADAAAIRT